TQSLDDTVYWIDIAQRGTVRVTLQAAPISVAAGLRTHLFEKVDTVVMASATLCTAAARGGKAAAAPASLPPRQAAMLPSSGIFSLTLRLADAIPPEVTEAWEAERDALLD